MSAHQTKSFKRNEVSRPLLIGIFGLSLLVILYFLGIFTSANSAGGINEKDRVTVDGVTNTTQYLTSMVLHLPNSNETVILNYDKDLNALRIKGTINADNLSIGNNSASIGGSILGGADNETTTNVKDGVILGGEKNRMENTSTSIVVGGNNNNITKTDNVATIGASNTLFPTNLGPDNKEQVLIVGGNQNNIQGSRVVVLGEGNNTAGSDAVLIGKNINTSAVKNVFVWSDSNNAFTPTHTGAFYINTQNGLGLNTTNPQVMADFSLGGAARIGVTASSVASCNETYKGLIAQVTTGGNAGIGVKSGLCGCNGENWIPLTTDSDIEAVCANMQTKACTGTLQNATGTTNNIFIPRWNAEANNQEGAWIDVIWTYGGTTWADRTSPECGYLCNTGYHPGVTNPDGWQTGGCQACTAIPNQYLWTSAGTGNNNCDFNCNGGYRYQNVSGKLRACPLCSTDRSYTEKTSRITKTKIFDKARYSSQGNQLIECNACNNKPANASYTALNMSGSLGNCPWQCDDGYNKSGNNCKKAERTEQIGPSICRSSGVWKDAYKKHTFICKDTDGVVVDRTLCEIWGAQPPSYTSDFSDETCNEPSRTAKTCETPNCVGKCSGDTVKVKCTREKKDPIGNIIDSEITMEDRMCTTPCKSGTCQGTFDNAVRINPSEILTGDTTSTLVSDPTGAKCEWKCKDNYIKGKNPSNEDVCLQCREGTWNPTNRTCEAVPLCSDGYVAAPDENGILKCFPLGNCLDNKGNPKDKPYDFYSIFLVDSRPIAKNLEWEYVTTPLEKNKCQYYCEEGAFYYNARKRCEKTYCDWRNVDKNFAYFIDNVPSNQPYNNSISVKGEYLLPSDFQNKKNLNPQPLGCYYTCKEDKYKYFRNNAWQCWSEEMIKQYQDAENKNCKKLPTGVEFGIETKERPTTKNQDRTYVSKIADFGDSGCYWTCKEGYTKGLSNGIEGCYTKCEVNKYRYDNSSIFGFCSSCPTGKIGDENSPKIFGNPTSCRDACADKPGTMWSPLGGGRGSCISTAPIDLQCPEGMTLIIKDGENKCLSCIAPQTLNESTGLCE